MDSLLTIGALAERCRLSRSALRFYDQCGLLRPIAVDDATGYRYYGEDQVDVANIVRQLRRAEVPVEGVRAFLAAGTDLLLPRYREPSKELRPTRRSAPSTPGVVLQGARPLRRLLIGRTCAMMVAVSFDVFLQRFRSGAAADADAGLLADILKPYLVDTEQGFPRMHFGDGVADIYGLENLATGFMVSHVSGSQAWDVLTDIARLAGLAILWPGDPPVAVPSADLIDDLPDKIRNKAVVVGSGQQLLDIIRVS
jgi:DNA-binding transcriptional MerR regulator